MRQSVIDRIIGAVSPAAGLARLQARARLDALASGYKGASLTRSASAGWQIPRGSPDDLLRRDLATLRRRSEDLGRNNPLATGAIHTKAQGVVGTGLSLHAAIDRDVLRLSDDQADAWERTAERLFRLWAESKDSHIKRSATFYEQQELAFRAVLLKGDHFIQLTQSRASELPFRLALQHIAAPRVCNPDRRPDSTTLVQGIERDAAGVPLAVHVASDYPDSNRSDAGYPTWQRLPLFDALTQRRRVLHLMRVLDDDHTRGVPDLAAVIEPLKQLDRYTDAEIDAAVKNSLFALLVQSPTGAGLAGMGVDEWAETRQAYYQERPLTLREGESNVLGLFPDDEITSFDPSRPNAGYDPFISAVFKQIGVALELPYEVLTKAFESSYSAARAALLQAQAFFHGRRVWLASALCQPVYAAFIDEQVAAGRLAAPGYFADPLVRAAYLGSEWVGDSFGQIDEGKAIAAARERIALGVSTLKRETAALTGEDYDQVARQRAKELRQGAPAVQPSGTVAAPSAEDLDRADREEKPTHAIR